MEAVTNLSRSPGDPPDYILSFDVEEHHRIEVAQGVRCSAMQHHEYAQRMEARTRDILSWLSTHHQRATFFVVGEVAQKHRNLICEIVAAGHEVAAHGWRHERVDRMNRQQFQIDVRRCKTALEDAAGVPVLGYRAPSFSIGWQTPWVADVLAECGYRYDASIYPVRHDRYGIPNAPRGPFWLIGKQHRLLELPALTWRGLGRNWAIGGGGYFRLWPLALLHAALHQVSRLPCPVGVLYFHPWEFDPDQPRLPLRGLARWRTYVGVRHTTSRFQKLLQRYRFVRAWDVVEKILQRSELLPTFSLAQPASLAI